jgi:hypothetical protein
MTGHTDKSIFNAAFLEKRANDRDAMAGRIQMYSIPIQGIVSGIFFCKCLIQVEARDIVLNAKGV